jgi:hypothetical protein
MNQLEKELSRQIDELIVSCAIGMGCDEAELKRLASEYGNVAHSYTLSKNRVAFDFEHEKKTAMQLEQKVNNIIIQQRRIYGELGSRRSSFKTRKPKTPSPTKASPKASPTKASPTKASPTKASPKASPTKASPKTSPKASPKACSPKTRRSYCNMMGGKRRTNTKRRRN